MNKRIEIMGTIGMTVLVSLLVLIQTTTMVYAWQLTHNLEQTTFGTKHADLKVTGPFGWIARDTVPISTDTIASFDLPDDQFPNGYEYEVCVNNNFSFSWAFPNCYMFTHKTNGDVSVSIDIP
jgi:hypothetical protein